MLCCIWKVQEIENLLNLCMIFKKWKVVTLLEVLIWCFNTDKQSSPMKNSIERQQLVAWKKVKVKVKGKENENEKGKEQQNVVIIW